MDQTARRRTRRNLRAGFGPPREPNSERGAARRDECWIRSVDPRAAPATTLGGRTVTRRLEEAADSGLRVRVWYVGLASPEKHIERVRARVLRRGNDIPEDRIRSRWTTSRENLVRLLPRLHELALFDNTKEARLDEGEVPPPLRVIHVRARVLLDLAPPDAIPSWARPIVAAALKLKLMGP